MTPTEKLHQSQRKWTPRLLTANTVFSAGAVILWFFVSNWINETKTDLASLRTMLSNNAIQYESRLTKTETRLDQHEMRLARLER